MNLKTVVIPAMIAGTIAIAGCGSSSTTTGKVAAATTKTTAPPAKVVVVPPQPKTDPVQCLKLTTDVTDIISSFQSNSNATDAEFIAAAPGIERKIKTAQGDIGQLLDEATQPSDQRRLNAILSGVSQFYAAMIAVEGDDITTAYADVNTGVAELGNAADTSSLQICGGGAAGSAS